jgi:predicted branched-subunit amino acid permease
MSAVPPPADPPLWRHPEFARGARGMAGLALGVAAWGLVTGIAMAQSGLGVALSVAMSLLVFAGSAQLAALPLIVQGAPIWVVWAMAICVNLRFVVFSAIWRPYLATLRLRERLAMAYVTADFNYISFMRRFPQPGPMDEQRAYFWGGASLSWAAWQASSLLGIFFADRVPGRWGLGFAGSMALLALAGTLLVDRNTWIAAAVAGCAAVAAFSLPFHLNIVVAIAAALAVGILIDHAKPPAPAKGAESA